MFFFSVSVCGSAAVFTFTRSSLLTRSLLCLVCHRSLSLILTINRTLVSLWGRTSVKKYSSLQPHLHHSFIITLDCAPGVWYRYKFPFPIYMLYRHQLIENNKYLDIFICHPKMSTKVRWLGPNSEYKTTQLQAIQCSRTLMFCDSCSSHTGVTMTLSFVSFLPPTCKVMKCSLCTRSDWRT